MKARRIARRMIDHIHASYRGRLWMLHVAGCIATAAIVLSSLDWQFYQATRHPALRILVAVAGLGGFLVPVLLPAWLYASGRSRRIAERVRLATSLFYASASVWIIVAAYKAITGRLHPDALGVGIDISQGFQFGLWRHGIFWGWPSHHTAVAAAGATVLYLMLRRTSWRVAAVIWACVVGAGAAVGFHWLSDVVAGALVGIAAGYAAVRMARTRS